MITNAILSVLYPLAVGFVDVIDMVIPDTYTMPTELSASIEATGNAAMYLNEFVPISSIIGVILMIIFVSMSLITVKIVTWGLRRLPTQS